MHRTAEFLRTCGTFYIAATEGNIFHRSAGNLELLNFHRQSKNNRR